MLKNKKSWGHFYGAFNLMDSICDDLRDLVQFGQLKNLKNTHVGVLPLVKLQAKAWTSLKVTLLHGSFSRFLNCTNGTKSKASHMSSIKMSYTLLNPFQPSVTFHIETNHSFSSTKQTAGFYMKRNTGLKWVNWPFIIKISRDYPILKF